MIRTTAVLGTEGVTKRAATRSSRSRPRNVPPPSMKLNMRSVGKLPMDQRPSNILINEVPKTVLPSDLLRSLREIGAVGPDFSISNITSPPPSYPRKPSLTKTYHLTTDSPARAQDIHRLLSTHPIFASSSSLLHSQSYPRTGRRSTSAANLGLPEADRISYSEWDAESWVEAMINRDVAKSRDLASSREMETDEDSLIIGRDGGSGLAGGNVSGVLPRRREVDPPSTEWAMRSGMKGRRVVIKGLPGMVLDADVRKLAKDCGLEHGDEGCMRLPPSPRSIVSTYVLTTTSVAMAYKLARKVHMNYYLSSILGERYLMIAEVAW